MPAWLEPVARTGRDLWCGVLASGNLGQDVYGNSIPRLETNGEPVGDTLSSPNFAPSAVQAACGIGPEPNSPAIQPGRQYRPLPAFTGGRCAGVSYRLTVGWTYKLYPSGQPTNNPPFGSAQVNFLGPFYGLYANDYPSPILRLSSGSGSGTFVDGILNDTLDYGQITNIVITRLDGQPDNCNSLPPDSPIGPPVPVPDPTNPTRPPIVIIPIVPVIIGAIGIFPRFKLEVNPTLNLIFSPTFNWGRPHPPGVYPPYCDCKPSPADPVLPPINDPPPDGFRRLVGVAVRFDPPYGREETQIFPVAGGQASAIIFAPALGYIKWRVTRSGETGWSPDVPLKSVQCWAEAPEGAYDYEVFSRGGNTNIATNPVFEKEQ